MNVLMCSVGRRAELVKDFKKTMGQDSVIVATDNSEYAPALYFADKKYIVPLITDDNYINILVDICKAEKIDVMITLIDPEIAILSKHRKIFESLGVDVLVPGYDTAKMCFNKYDMYNHLIKNNIDTVLTFGDINSFLKAKRRGKINFPVFVKPRTGSGSVGARKIDTQDELEYAMKNDKSLIIQEYMGNAVDVDVDVYVDTISRKAVSVFSKKKISTTIGGANKTISFRDENLVRAVNKVVDVFGLYGPNDMDFFYKDGVYYLSEINPRFGGAYLHAYGAGVDFIKLIENNWNKMVNNSSFGAYEEGLVMMMYDSIVFREIGELIE